MCTHPDSEYGVRQQMEVAEILRAMATSTSRRIASREANAG